MPEIKFKPRIRKAFQRLRVARARARSQRRAGWGLLLTLFALAIAIALQPAVLSTSPPPSPTTVTAADRLEEGKNLYRSGRLVEAATVWREAVREAESNGASLKAIQALNYLATVEQDLGNWEAAKAAIAQSLQHLQDPANPATESAKALLAQALNNRGSLQLSLGETSAALATWQEAESLYARAGNTTGELGSKINQARALQVLGFYQRAEDLLNAANDKLQAREDSPLKAEGLRSLGQTLQVVGNFRRAKEVLEESWQVSERLNDSAEVGATLLEIGNIARALHQNDVALDYYQEAAQRATTAIARLEAQINRFSLLVSLQQSTPALEILPEIEADLNPLPPSRFAVFARVNVAESLIKIAPNEKTARLIAVAIQQARELKDARAEAYALTQLGRLYERTGQWQEAYGPSQQATQIAQSIHGEDIVARSAWQLGRILKQKGDRNGAIASYEQAIEALGSLRSDLATIDRALQFDFKESVEPVYREFVSLLLQPSPGSEVPQDYLRKAREAIEALQIAEIDNYFQEACFPAQSVAIDRIDSHAAAIYPIILSDRLEIVVSLSDRPLQHYSTPLTQDRLEATFQQLYSSFYLGYSSVERLRLSQQVYDWLLRPIETQLASNGIKTLVFVLDGFLQNLPMAALHDGQHYLIENYSIAISPGLQLVPDRLKNHNPSTLAAGLTEARQGFPPLPAVEREMQAVETEVGAKVLLDRAFTLSAFQTQMSERSFQIVHLATHGQFSSNPDDTFVLAWDEQINVKEFDRILRSRTPGSESVELLVLSACRTAAGDRRAALGLAGFALRSGARSTLATLWSVNDLSAAELMSEFYEQLVRSQPGMTKAEALRQAQLKLLRDRSYQHPYFWAPFVLVGNWL
ncbi:CHAT domain-containing protein [Oscillatoria sp. FACHB-1406]|uniref:CHAT domain-containing protein n=1 Tax=Oscillatoria sp. FACHB-1406 TaxID=2692846 RepID=UPI001686E63C|nr:CHAT domain-containing protein [Oscillatoria sp. FACHB-1406]MBD2578841.1 CHAT domain-containing protein [Oscillatoria sp. FACHB-1406]